MPLILVGCAQTAAVLDESMLGGMVTAEHLGNTTFLMAEGLEHRKNVFWRGPEWLSMVGGMSDR